MFYRLREEMGEQALNRALSRFLQAKAFQQPPYTTSVELLEFIRAEAGPAHQALITDLFEKIGFYDNRVVEATTTRRADGRHDVTMKLHADKRYADGLGKETPGTLDDWIEVGVFAKGASDKERDEKVLYLQRHHGRAGVHRDRRRAPGRGRLRALQQTDRPRVGRQPQAGRLPLRRLIRPWPGVLRCGFRTAANGYTFACTRSLLTMPSALGGDTCARPSRPCCWKCVL